MPYLWRRPRCRTYNYHEQVSQLYYSPMMDYMQNRPEGHREKVDLPDRAQANYNRSDEVKKSDYDLGTFLEESYLTRGRHVNIRTVRAKNELIRHSLGRGEPTML